VRKRAPLAAINVTPLVDVLLILVAVLLLLAPHFVKPLPVELPRSSINGTPVLQSSVQVAVLANGQLKFEGHEIALADLKGLIKPGVTSLQIGADGKAEYAQIVAVVEALRDTNPREVVLLTQ
jgi:biopolymer transport protein ExbD